MGAAVQGVALAGAVMSAVLVDITLSTFGTSAVGDLEGEPYPSQASKQLSDLLFDLET
jgi:hypothetical protein